MTKVNNLLAVAAVAAALTMSACGGSDDGISYKEPFGFLEATGSSYPPEASLEGGVIPGVYKYHKRKETAEQTKILDKMMAGSDKKVAIVSLKSFYDDDWGDVTFKGYSTTNGANLKRDGLYLGELLSIYLEPKEFPEVLVPFEKYYIIVDKNGNVARIQRVLGSYSWLLEHPITRAHIYASASYSGSSWKDSQKPPQSVLDSRREFWEEKNGNGLDDPYSVFKPESGRPN